MTEIPIVSVVLVLLLLAFTIGITIVVKKQTQTSADFYLAGGKIGVFQNASAISGDYLSAASFLGVAGAVFMSGYDGVLFAFGFFLGYVLLLFFIASPLKKFGQYTIPDFVAGRFNSKRGRLVGIICVLMISLFYLAPQMLGVGKVIGLLLGVPYMWAVISAGVVITFYVALGGMKGTTFNQIIQFWILLMAVAIIAVFALGQGYGYSKILDEIGSFSGPIAGTGEFTEDGKDVTFDGAKWVAPGMSYDFKNAFSLLIALCLGTAGLPHILVRFYTNPSGAKAKWTVIYVLFFIGAFYIISPYVGAVARYILLTNPGLSEGMLSQLITNGKNLAVPVTGSFFGGEVLLGIAIAGAAAAVLSTVAGLLIACASALGHDLYTHLINPTATEAQKVRVGKISTFIMGGVTIILGLLVENLQIAVLVGLAFSIAASTVFPVLFIGIWWKRCTEKGAIAGMIVGLIASFILIIFPQHLPSFLQYSNPALISVPLVFLTIYFVSIADGKVPANVNEFMKLVHGPMKETPQKGL
jgi:cation/acetate symporter